MQLKHIRKNEGVFISHQNIIMGLLFSFTTVFNFYYIEKLVSSMKTIEKKLLH